MSDESRASETARARVSELLQTHRETLLRRIRLLMGPRARRKAESSDFLQGVFVEVLEAAERFTGRTDQDFLRWATRIARNNVIDASRRDRERRFSSFAQTMTKPGALFDRPDEGPSPSQDVAKQEAIDDVIDAMLDMPELLQRVLELRNFERMSFRAIGVELDRSENAAQLLHTRALVKLGQSLRRSQG